MTLLLGAFTIGLILSLLAMGIFVSFRVCNFQDLTADGSITLGAAVAATLLVHNVDAVVATMAAVAAGMLAGLVTGALHTRFKISRLLSGILVMTALYSVNLHVMGKSNVPLLGSATLLTRMEQSAAAALGPEPRNLLGWEVSLRDLAALIAVTFTIITVAFLLYWFFRTNLGTAMRATGDNDQMVRALGVSDGTMLTLGLGVSNGLIALSGALLAQYQGFADVQMGIGMVVLGLASVIIGETLVGDRKLGLIITAFFVFLALIMPRFLAKLASRKKAEPAHA
ncbi:MAG: ABC transporter permease [Acidimicrobiia bacterium]|nr:ABC transporter permease [Acidimicrobiia bacterium]